ncbi:hypothetical protein HXA32_20450 [Salipaludibacillus agaradhaerens]|jgi:hypothetical protein|uniref:hypothetical protein n=1 Tax=Salipaludibacillus agaradhaerens TaxID=76935 RepID=UPI002151C71F|nr:hypothetical protein [Salipaludibacillus agaradhaerens]MCR6108645.1 hypothetical protein [Salipaludibacillus agaradhaerens]
MTLLTVSLFYLAAGSAVFIRRKLGVEHKDADYMSLVLFYTGVVQFTLGIFEWFYPSVFWGIPLVISLIVMAHLILKRTARVLNYKCTKD